MNSNNSFSVRSFLAKARRAQQERTKKGTVSGHDSGLLKCFDMHARARIMTVNTIIPKDTVFSTHAQHVRTDNGTFKHGIMLEVDPSPSLAVEPADIMTSKFGDELPKYNHN